MSYASTMEFLRTGISSGEGTEDPRYAGAIRATRATFETSPVQVKQAQQTRQAKPVKKVSVAVPGKSLADQIRLAPRGVPAETCVRPTINRPFTFPKIIDDDAYVPLFETVVRISHRYIWYAIEMLDWIQQAVDDLDWQRAQCLWNEPVPKAYFYLADQMIFIGTPSLQESFGPWDYARFQMLRSQLEKLLVLIESGDYTIRLNAPSSAVGCTYALSNKINFCLSVYENRPPVSMLGMFIHELYHLVGGSHEEDCGNIQPGYGDPLFSQNCPDLAIMEPHLMASFLVSLGLLVDGNRGAPTCDGEYGQPYTAFHWGGTCPGTPTAQPTHGGITVFPGPSTDDPLLPQFPEP